MRPIKLVISAFGPYKDIVEIDFTKLGDNGIFLITGVTGSGKTTIFDALSFALFGEASGSRRENSSFRSDFASDDISTFVKLEFMHKDICYTIERIPRYTRKKKRGDGITTVGGDASLTYLDKVVTGDVNVTDKCIEILGMNANQFKQIVMIAQGEFLDLLLAKTKDRATIFRHIFDTGIYKNISDKLKNNYLAKKREYEDIAITINGYIQSIQLNSELSGDESIEYILNVLEKEIDNDALKEKDLDNERNKLFKESSKIVEVISEGKIINDSIFNLNNLKEKLKLLLEDENNIKVKEETLKKNKDIWDLIMPKYEEILKLRKELADKKVKLDSSKKEAELISEDYEKVVVQYNGLNDKLNEIQVLNKLIIDLESKVSLFEEIEQLEKDLIELDLKFSYCSLVEKRNLLDKFDFLSNKELEISSLREKLIILKNEYVRDNELYGRHYDLFLSAQAGILASTLKEGVACPVCGSINHPKIASLVSDVFSKEDLDEEKVLLDKKFQELESLRIDLLNEEKDLEILKRDLFDFEKNSLVSELNELEDKCAEISFDVGSVDIKDLEEEFQRLNFILNDKKKILGDVCSNNALEEEIAEKRGLVSNLEVEIEKIRNEYSDLLNKKTSIDSFINVLSDDIKKLDKNIVDNELEYVKTYKWLGYDTEESYIMIRLSKEEILILEKDINKYKEQLVEFRSSISSLEKIINGREERNLDVFEEQLNIINKQIEEVELSFKKVNNKLFNNKNIYSKLKVVSDKMKKLEHEVMLCKDLSDTANGSIVGKSKLEFEQYVQSSYFDRVLIAANKRFSFMTDDRYQLVRKEESVRVSDKLGLELEVMDYYTGKKRDVKSLSGGESFKASLALALGMSDTIQEFSGGIVVDAMFIDEGFGSLDDDSLEQAMNAIMMLSNGNKIIGIISHVNELKARIDKKIVIKKSNNGSSVSFVL